MHISNGFLDAKICAGTFLLAGAGVAVAARAALPQLDSRKLNAMGAIGAFLLAAQMVNYPIAGGTSGHLLGGFLAALLVGPAAAALVLTVVLTVQALLFHDGGTLALGANVLNLALVAPLAGLVAYEHLQRFARTGAGQLLCAAVAAWISVVASATVCSVELALAGTASLAATLPNMLLHHAQIGLGEALITAGCLAVFMDFVPGKGAFAQPLERGGSSRLTGAAILAAGVALLLATIGVSSPDGLAATLAALGIDSSASAFSPLAGYSFPALTGKLALVTAGAVGAVTVFVLARFVFGALRTVRIKR